MPHGYEAPAIDEVFDAKELDREILYAGIVITRE